MSTLEVSRDLDANALDRHLRDADVPRSGALGVHLVRNGRSHRMYKVVDDESAWVLRRPIAPGGHPAENDVLSEFGIISALASADVPVPTPVTASTATSILGAPFMMTDFVEGPKLRTRWDIADYDIAGADLRRCTWALVDALVAVHAVVPHEVGLIEDDPSVGHLRRQVQRWNRQWSRVRQPGDVRDDAVSALCTALVAALPAPAGCSVVHGNYRIDNAVFDAEDHCRIRAVVDWGMAALGDPLEDVALMCAYRDPLAELVIGADAAWTSPLLPSAETIATVYSRSSGRPLRHWPFYTALAYLRMAVTAAGIAHHARQGGSGDRAADAVAPLLDKGRRVLAKG